MRLGIRKIEWIDSALVHDYSVLAPGSSLDFSSYIKAGGSLAELPFTTETANMEEQWMDTDAGQYSRMSFKASVRRNKDSYKDVLQQLTGKKAIYKLTLVSGREIIIGSPEYVPTFTFTDSISGNSNSEFSISIENESAHGLLDNRPE